MRLPTERADTWEIQGRGDLALAVFVETIRREGFELTVSKPQVLGRNVNGEWCEPIERLDLDLPEEHFGRATEVLASRRSQIEHVLNHGTDGPRIVAIHSRPGHDRAADGAVDQDAGDGASAPRLRRLMSRGWANPQPCSRQSGR